MQIKRLLKAIRRREVVYNTDHPKYYDEECQAQAWEEIAKEVNQPATLCKSKWQKVREVFWETMCFDFKFWRSLEYLSPVMERKIHGICSIDVCAAESTSQGTTAAATTTTDAISDTTSVDEDWMDYEEEDLERQDLIHAIEDSNQLIRELMQKKESDIQLFFKSIALSVERLNLKRRLSAQQKILKIVNDLSEEQG